MALPDPDAQADHRQWTQQHLDAADLRASAMAPTPPQGEADADCMDVNVRGPGECAAGRPAPSPLTPPPSPLTTPPSPAPEPLTPPPSHLTPPPRHLTTPPSPAPEPPDPEPRSMF